MPEMMVRGVTLNYEVVGEGGPMVSLTPGSRRNYGELVPMARLLAGYGYQVLLHDRRNCGASDVSMEPLGSEYEIWADDLQALAQALGVASLYVGGSSSGARLAIVFALRHPEALQGLLLWRITGGQHASETLAERYYGDFARVAAEGGMAAVAETAHFRDCIAARSSNRERLLGMNVKTFISVMQTWRQDFLHAASLPVIGATEEQLRALRVPACIMAGNDRVHTPATARKIASLIPGAEFHDDIVEKRSDQELLDEWDRAEWRAAEPQMVSVFRAFLDEQVKV